MYSKLKGCSKLKVCLTLLICMINVKWLMKNLLDCRLFLHIFWNSIESWNINSSFKLCFKSSRLDFKNILSIIIIHIYEFQCIYTICTYQISVINISPSLTLLCDQQHGASLFCHALWAIISLLWSIMNLFLFLFLFKIFFQF